MPCEQSMQRNEAEQQEAKFEERTCALGRSSPWIWEEAPIVSHRKKLAILVGGGPAPGINSVIGAATIRAQLDGVDVLGVRDGFEWIMHGNVEHVAPLSIEDVSRIHFR